MPASSAPNNEPARGADRSPAPCSKQSYDEAENPLLSLGRRSLTTESMIDKIRDARNLSKRRLTDEELAERPWKRTWSPEWRDYMLYKYYVYRRVRSARPLHLTSSSVHASCRELIDCIAGAFVRGVPA